MSELAKIDPAPAPAVQANDSAVILTMIDKLLTRPDVSVEKLEQMFVLHQKVRADAARMEYLSAFADLQAELPAATRLGKGHNAKTYARFEDVMAALRPHLHRHGFSLSHRVDTSGNQIRVTGILGHRGGHTEQTEMTLPPDSSGGKTPVHAMASAVSYGKRYVTLTLTGIATEDDDDGKGAGGFITDEQASELRDLIAKTSTDIDEFLRIGEVESLSDIPAAQFQKAKALLVAKLNKVARK